MTVAFDYNPEQAREPGGSPEGGRFTKDGGGGGGESTKPTSDVDKFLAEHPQKPGEADFEYQSRITAGLEPDQRHALLFEMRERYEPVDYIAAGADRYRAEHRLPNPTKDLLDVPAPLAKGEVVARAFEKTPDQSGDPKVQAAYEDFKKQNEEMYGFMTKPEAEGGLGIKIDFSPYEKGDPYPTAKAQAEDLRDNHHMTTQSGLGGEHSLSMSTEEYDRFRAVHDVFGHAAIGGGFDRHGEYEAYLMHQSMYTGDGAKAMASEYHGVNTAAWAGEKGTPGTGKTVLLPDALIPKPFDDRGNLVKARARSRADVQRAIAFAGKPEPLLDPKQTKEIKDLAAQLGMDDTFAEKFDALGWHYSKDHAPRPPTASLRDRLVATAEFDESLHPRDHGRFAEKEGEDTPGVEKKPPAGWIPISRDVGHTIAVSHLRDRGFPPALSEYIAKEYRDNVLTEYAGPNGSVLIVDDTRVPLNPGVADRMMETITDLQENFPREGMTVRVGDVVADPMRLANHLPSATWEELGQGNESMVGGATLVGSSLITVNPIAMNDPTYAQVGDTVKGANISVIVSHEWGHTMDSVDRDAGMNHSRMAVREYVAEGHVQTVDQLQAALPSVYAGASPEEAYAEAFAEHYVRGGDRGAMSDYGGWLADHEGWELKNRTASGLLSFNLTSMIHEALLAFYSPDQPRDWHGRFGEGGSDTGSTLTAEDVGTAFGGQALQVGGDTIALKGTKDGKGTPDDPLYVDGDYSAAVEALAEGKSIRMDDEKQASVLVGKLGDVAIALKEQGEKAPDFNICDVSAGETNVFCGGNKGIPRTEMPQLSGVALDGSQAADLRRNPDDSSERVNAGPAYLEALERANVSVVDRQEKVSMLRSTQSEMNGGQVGAILRAIERNGIQDITDRRPVYITKDGYVLDGHHRYAAALAADILDGGKGDLKIPVREVGMEIGAALDFTKSFAQDFGIKPASMQSVRLMQASSPKPRDEFFDYYGKPNRTLNYEYGDPNRPLGVLDYGSKESDQRQVRGLDFAAIPLTRMVAEALAAFEYNPDQARVPKGDPDGGQFTKDGGGGGAEATSDLKTEGHLAQFDAAGRALPPPTNPRARGREVEKLTDDLMAAGLDTQTLHDTVDGQLGHYTTEREALHHEIIDEIMQDADNRGVPRDYEAVMLGGLPAAGKSSAVAEMLDTDKYIVINPDLMKEALAERHAYETPAGMGRMEGSSLVHEESSTLAKALAQEAISQGYNVAFDMTMQNEKAFTSRADMLDKYGGGQYKLTGIFVDVPIQQSLDMAAKRYGDELKTMPDMARHVPTSFITDSVDHSGRWDSTNEATFESVKDRMDGFLKIDNTNFKKEIVDSSPGALDLLRRK